MLLKRLRDDRRLDREIRGVLMLLDFGHGWQPGAYAKGFDEAETQIFVRSLATRSEYVGDFAQRLAYVESKYSDRLTIGALCKSHMALLMIERAGAGRSRRRARAATVEVAERAQSAAVALG